MLAAKRRTEFFEFMEKMQLKNNTHFKKVICTLTF